MKKNILKMLILTGIILSTSMNTQKVHASPQDDITVLNSKIDVLQTQVSEIGNEIGTKEVNISEITSEITKRDKIIVNVNNKIDNSEKNKKENIQI